MDVCFMWNVSCRGHDHHHQHHRHHHQHHIIDPFPTSNVNCHGKQWKLPRQSSSPSSSSWIFLPR
eukprot:1861813-Karenia_brevis.AAC.1